MLQLNKPNFLLQLTFLRVQRSPMLMFRPVNDRIQAAVATVVHEDDLVGDVGFKVRQVLLPVEGPPFHLLLHDLADI